MIRIGFLGFTVTVLILAMATGLGSLFVFLVGFLYCSFLVWWMVSNPVVEDDDEQGVKTPPHKL